MWVRIPLLIQRELFNNLTSKKKKKMDYLIAINGETAYICKLPVVEDVQAVAERLEREENPNMEELIAFKRGDVVLDLSNNLHHVTDIHMPSEIANSTEWYITDNNGEHTSIESIKGILIKEVPKYHIDGLLS